MGSKKESALIQEIAALRRNSALLEMRNVDLKQRMSSICEAALEIGWWPYDEPIKFFKFLATQMVLDPRRKWVVAYNTLMTELISQIHLYETDAREDIWPNLWEVIFSVIKETELSEHSKVGLVQLGCVCAGNRLGFSPKLYATMCRFFRKRINKDRKTWSHPFIEDWVMMYEDRKCIDSSR